MTRLTLIPGADHATSPNESLADPASRHAEALKRINQRLEQAPCPHTRSVRAFWAGLEERWNAPHSEPYYDRKRRRNDEMWATFWNDLIRVRTYVEARPVLGLVVGVGLLVVVVQLILQAWTLKGGS